MNKGANADHKDHKRATSLIWASQNGELEVVKILLANHVDVSTKDKDGWTALMRASQQGHHKIVKLLKENGAK